MERCRRHDIDCEYAPKPLVSVDSVRSCMFDGTSVCKLPVTKIYNLKDFGGKTAGGQLRQSPKQKGGA